MSIATTDVTPDHVSNKVSGLRSGDFQSGVDAYYTPISKTWGFKMYQDLHKAYFTYWRQRILSTKNLAPQVGQQMPAIKVSEEKFNWERPMYGYIVESVRIQKYTPTPEIYGVNYTTREYCDAVTTLRKAVDAVLDAETWDYNQGNIGFNDNDELLLVDCGDGDNGISYGTLMELKSQLQDYDLWRGEDEEYLAWGEPQFEAW